MILRVISQRITSNHGKDRNWIGKLCKLESGRVGIDKMKARSFIYMKRGTDETFINYHTYSDHKQATGGVKHLCKGLFFNKVLVKFPIL